MIITTIILLMEDDTKFTKKGRSKCILYKKKTRNE